MAPPTVSHSPNLDAVSLVADQAYSPGLRCVTRQRTPRPSSVWSHVTLSPSKSSVQKVACFAANSTVFSAINAASSWWDML